MDLSRRQLIATSGGALMLSVIPCTANAAQMVDVRMWPAKEYTRVTLEHDRPIKFRYFIVRSPKPVRLVVDIENLQLTARLQKMISAVSPNDPFVKAIRIAQYNPKIVRLVMDLKTDVRPEVFSLKPVANYKHRLIFDIYPIDAEIDPIAGVIAGLNEPQKETKKTVVAKTDIAPTKKEPPKPVARQAQPKKKEIVIVIDAGHGGEDPGAVGKRKTYEKHITLAIAKRLERLIRAEKGMKAVMTRSSDHFVSLAQRVMIAQKAKAHLFVSIHADAWTKPSAKGASVYTLAERGATSSAAMWLAKNQNEADLIGGANFNEFNKKIQNVLVDMTTNWKIDYSLSLGHCILQRLGKINTLHRNNVEQAGFLVLKAPGIPSVLVETAFISNPQEEKKLKTADYQQKVAVAILQGIKNQVASDNSILE